MRKSLFAAITALLVASLAVLAIPEGRATPLGRQGTYRFFGAGFGHGAGMSQYGAKAAADAGRGAGEILAHYYQGTALANRAQPALRVWLADAGTMGFNTSGPIVVTADPSGPQATVDTTPSGSPSVQVVVDGDGISLTQGTNKLIGPVPGPIAIRPQSSPQSLCSGVPGSTPCIGLTATGHRYRLGVIEVARVSGTSTLRAVVRELGMEAYLYGLGEMPSSWHAEALRAQAIAARTYALEKVNRLGQNRSGCSCGLLRTTSDQNYVGFEKEAETQFFPRWKQAVDSSAETVVTSGGNPIQALYHSSSGGHTEHNEFVFGGGALPYLRGVPDLAPDTGPHREWARSYAGTDLETWLNANSATAVGTLQAIEVDGPYGVSGRPQRVSIIGSSGSKTVSGNTFRTVVNGGAPSATDLPSPLFQLGYQPYGRGFRGGVFVAGGLDGSRSLVTAGAGAGGGPHVVVQDINGNGVGSFFAYSSDFTGGVRVAVCDVNGDGSAEIITGPGGGGGPHVRVFSASGSLVSNGFMAFDPNFRGGIYVGCANVDGSGGSEIVVGAGAGGGPHVKVFRSDGSAVASFFAYDGGFRGGVRVGDADVHSAPGEEVITGAGAGGGPHVKVFGAVGTAPQEVGGFFAYAVDFTAGVYVAGVDGSPTGAIITGAGEGGGPHVTARRLDGTLLINSFAFGGPMANGARVGGLNGGVLASTGPGTWPIVRFVP